MCSCLRAPWRSLCGGLSWWDSGAERNEVSPNWHRNFCYPFSQEHSWMVRNLNELCFTTLLLFRWIIHDVVRSLSILDSRYSWATWILTTSLILYPMFTIFLLLSSPLFPRLPFLFSNPPRIITTSPPPPSSAVFTWTNLLVVVVELEGSEQEALDLVALVTNVVLEEHFLIVGVVVVVDPGVIPINSRGEKQRMHLRDGFLADQLDPIYVAYNMWRPRCRTVAPLCGLSHRGGSRTVNKGLYLTHASWCCQYGFCWKKLRRPLLSAHRVEIWKKCGFTANWREIPRQTSHVFLPVICCQQIVLKGILVLLKWVLYVW